MGSPLETAVSASMVFKPKSTRPVLSGNQKLVVEEIRSRSQDGRLKRRNVNVRRGGETGSGPETNPNKSKQRL